MIVLKKDPGQLPEMVEIENDLHSLQEAVGGYIEPVRSYVFQDGIFIVNEEGLINDMPKNCATEGHIFFGPVLFLGTDGEEFTDAPEDAIKRFRLQRAYGNLKKDRWIWL